MQLAWEGSWQNLSGPQPGGPCPGQGRMDAGEYELDCGGDSWLLLHIPEERDSRRAVSTGNRTNRDCSGAIQEVMLTASSAIPGVGMSHSTDWTSDCRPGAISLPVSEASAHPKCAVTTLAADAARMLGGASSIRAADSGPGCFLPVWIDSPPWKEASDRGEDERCMSL
jgi:hypothetical protein